MKTKKTRDRIEAINADIKNHRKNIKRLTHFFEEFTNIKRGSFSPRIVKYSCIPKSEKLYQFTLQNITNQLSLLERELAVLMEYGS